MSISTHGGNIYKFAKNKNIAPLTVLDFSANINPLGMSKLGLEAMQNSLLECCHYPDPNNEDLLSAVEEHYKIPKENILLGNGAAELLFAVCRLESVQRVLIPNPGFSEYKEAANAAHLEIEEYTMLHSSSKHSLTAEKELKDKVEFKVSYDDILTILAKDRSKRTLIFLGNPNNPDGSVLSKKDFLEFLDKLSNFKTFVLLDESFIDFIGEDQSYRDLIGKQKNLLILHSLTKYLAVPGLRVGCLYCDDELKNELQQYIPTWSINRLAQVYATKALQDKEYLIKSTNYVQKEKIFMVQELQKFPFLESYRPSVNFILLHWKLKSYLLPKFQEFLERKNILIRSCASYSNLDETWFRVAIKKHEDNIIFLQHLQEFSYEHNLLG